MKKLLLALSIFFGVLCFVGAGYVLYTGGKANAGYACIPMLICIICAQGYRTIDKTRKK